MSSGSPTAESKVSGNQANIPAEIRRQLGIEDGDQLRWTLADDGTLEVEVVTQERGTFDDFEGYDAGSEETDVRTDHDEWGV